MKSRILIVFAAAVCLGAIAAPPFVTPSMIKRNGLTDEQYEMLWRQGKNPKIDIATARDWIYRASRYQNVTNWLEVCGRSNDFARLSNELQGENFRLSETNALLNRLARSLSQLTNELNVAVEDWRTAWEAQTNQYAEAQANLETLRKNLAESIAEYNSASNRAARAEAQRTAVISWCETQRDKAMLPTTKAIWQSFIDKLKGED